QEYFDLYPVETLELSERREDDLDDLPERFKLLAGFEAKFGEGYHENLVNKGYDKQFVRAYLASVTFADEQVGRLLDAWYASRHGETGYVVLWSDHGYMLGEKNAWSKIKPWYDSSRSNLIIAGPDIPEGRVCDKSVSLLDVYPTLVDLLELPKPPQPLDGRSLVPLLKDSESGWQRPALMTGQMDGIFFESVLDNEYRMTRLITGETELYRLSDDPHEFTNLAGSPEHTEVIERLEKHLSFRYPEIPEDGWIEAETIPAQTSADYKLRGNCHYVRTIDDTKVLVADLSAGEGSYIDFVVKIKAAGNYQIGGRIATSGNCSVQVDDVKNDAKQSDAGYPMAAVGSVPASSKVEDVSVGIVHFDAPGFKIIRFVSTQPKQRVKFDRLRVERVD
ncbi:MAG: sulfatase-like hydrolase/transferase, partial [Verrucomicrobiota bacterium]